MAKDSLRFLDAEEVHFSGKVDILDKETGIKQYVAYMLDRTTSMFQWSGLPDTIPSYVLETYLQVFGYAAFLEVDDQTALNYPSTLKFRPGLYIMFGGIGGERDIYYRPRLFIGANQRLKESIRATIIYDKGEELVDKPCVVMRNDTHYMGLLPMFKRYAAQMVENDISIRSAQINARAQVGIAAATERDAESARKYLDGLEAGKLATISDSAFLEGVSIANVGTQSANVIIQLIELQQYLKASWFNDLGLNANFNMKREYISREEIGSQTDVLLPLVDDMLDSRRRYAELINELFGLSISVDKNSAWSSKDQTILNSLAAGAREGDIPLTNAVEDMLKGDTKGVSVMGDSEGGEARGSLGSGSEGNVEEQQESAIPEENVSEGQAEIVSVETPTVQVNVEVNVGGESDESEVSEKSEESDSE